MPMKGRPDGMRAVCEQREWEKMDAAKTGVFTLVQGGLTNEGEAERLARGASGAARTRSAKARLTSWPVEVAKVLAGATAPVAG
jgi:hypothetical protein